MPGFKIGVTHGLDAFIASLQARPRDIGVWTMVALNDTAKDVMAAEVASMSEVFDRPTRFTLNALYIQRASSNDLSAQVRFKEGFGSIPAWRYLGPQVEGGTRAKKSHERALERAGLLKASEFCVPGQGLTLDANGNMKPSDLVKMLADLGAGFSNSTAKTRKTKKGRARGRYMVLRPDAANTRYLKRDVQPGVYWRKPISSGAASAAARVGASVRGGIVPVLIFVNTPHYAKRLPYYQTARDVVARNFAMRFREAVAKYPPRLPAAAKAA